MKPVILSYTCALSIDYYYGLTITWFMLTQILQEYLDILFCKKMAQENAATAINTRIIKFLVFAIVLCGLIGVLIYVSTLQFNETSKNHILA